MTDQQIRQLINDPEKGLNSDLKKLQTMLKDHGINTTQKKIKEIRDKQNWYQLTKKVKKQKHFNSIMVPENSILYYMDVIVYNRFKIHGYQYILNVVDTNSRYVSSRALTNMKLKESTRGNKAFTLFDAVKEIMEEMGYPKELRCDNQFISDDFVKLMKENDVKVVYSETDDLIKNSLVESFNRTLADLLQNWRVSTGKTEWYKVLPMIIKKYNNTLHSTINAKPADVWSGKDINRQEIKRVVSKFTIGDKVRIVSNKKIFEKGDSIKNSKSIYVITHVVGNKYKLKNLESGATGDKLFNPRNLLKVTDVDEINKIIEPTQTETEKPKFIRTTPVKTRRNKKK